MRRAPLPIAPFPRSRKGERLRRWGQQALYGALWRSGSQDAYARRLRLVRRLVRRGKGLPGGSANGEVWDWSEDNPLAKRPS